MKAVLALALLLALPLAHALDLIAPADNLATRNGTITFEYHTSEGGCTLLLKGQQFPDLDAQQGLNQVQVRNLAPGAYPWNVTCGQETSQTRIFTIDTKPPSLTIVSPQNGTAQGIALSFAAIDDRAAHMACSVDWSGATLERLTVRNATQTMRNYSVPPGSGNLSLSCSDDAGNAASLTRSLAIERALFLSLSLAREQYALTEPIALTIDSVPGSEIAVDTCPDASGFVQCTSALIDTNVFPQTITLPYMNKTGPYVIDATARLAGQATTKRARFALANSLAVSIERSATPRQHETVNFTAYAQGGIAPYAYTWQASDGALMQGPTLTRTYETEGTFGEQLTVKDAAGNAKTINHTVVIAPASLVTILVLGEGATPIAKADVDFAGERRRTDSFGRTQFSVPQGTQQLFVSAQGHRYLIEEHFINGSTTITARLEPETESSVEILSTAKETAVPAVIEYRTSGEFPMECSLFHSEDGSWYQEEESFTVESSQAQRLTREYAAGEHHVRIECESKGRHISSVPYAFSVVTAPAPAGDEDARLQEALSEIEEAIGRLEAAGEAERSASEALGYEKRLRNAKRQVQQAIRDIDSLRHRADIDEDQLRAERNLLLRKAQDALAGLPRSISVTEETEFVRYVEEEQLPEVMEALSKLPGFSVKGERILADQQRFTLTTKVSHIEYAYPEKTQTVTLVDRSLTYAEDLEEGSTVIEIIPKEVAKSASELELLTGGEILEDDPILEFATQERIAYAVPRKIDFARIERIHTVLAIPRQASQGITGFAFLNSSGIGQAAWPLIILLAILLLAYLAYAAGLVGKIRSLAYRLGKKEQTHYLRVMITDAEDQLCANNYERAQMLYKEIRMTYEGLPAFMQNELYEEVLGLVHAMDAYYFNLMTIEMDQHLKAGDLEAAIASYEKLTFTYHQLDKERQQQLAEAARAMARRLNMEAAA